MWLLNATTRQLEYFLSPTAVPGGYSILSHTWGKDEPTFDDVRSNEAKTKEGYQKIDYSCRQALDDGRNYVWVDTVCIDKRSSAELSEAINSMFRWYRCAKKCYVYLQDFDVVRSGSADPQLRQVETIKELRSSRWFTRSWTLQELIAPNTVLFYDRIWTRFGDKHELRDLIHGITRIDTSVLSDSRCLSAMSVAKRMSWAAHRSASRDEDEAYSLLGLFNIAMPMLYGEGGMKAFRRLQEEIARSGPIADHSMLAWLAWPGMPDDDGVEPKANKSLMAKNYGLLAPSPFGFRHAHNIVSWASSQLETFEISHNGLRISLLFGPRSTSSSSEAYYASMDHQFSGNSRYAALRCRYADQPWTHIMLRLAERPVLVNWLDPFQHAPVENPDMLYDVMRPDSLEENQLLFTHVNEIRGHAKEIVTIARMPLVIPPPTPILQIKLATVWWDIVGSFPKDAWNHRDSMLTLMDMTGQDTVRRAAIGLSNPNNSKQFATVIFKVPRRYSTFPSARVCPGRQVSEMTAPMVFVTYAHCGKELLPWMTVSFDLHWCELEITSKLILVTGERMWSFTLTMV